MPLAVWIDQSFWPGGGICYDSLPIGVKQQQHKQTFSVEQNGCKASKMVLSVVVVDILKRQEMTFPTAGQFT